MTDKWCNKLRACLLAIPLAAMLASEAQAADPLVCGDVNDTGTVTSSDALFVLRYAVGQPVDLVCPDALVRYGFDVDRSFSAPFLPNYLFGVRVAVATSVTVTHLGMYARETGANVKMALYSDSAGAPGNLLASTPASELSVGGQEISVNQPIAISPGSYWITAVLDANIDIGSNDSAPAENIMKYRELEFSSALPATFGAADTDAGITLDFWMKVIQ